MTAISNLNQLLQNMEPHLCEAVFVYCTHPGVVSIPNEKIWAMIREDEGLTYILEESLAQEYGLSPLFRAARITLTVHSDLHAVGLTAAFSQALGRAGISCNVVAGAFHDHVFVPFEYAAAALRALKNLQIEACANRSSMTINGKAND